MKKIRFKLSEEQVGLLFFTLSCGLKLQGTLDLEVSEESIPEIKALILELAQQIPINPHSGLTREQAWGLKEDMITTSPASHGEDLA